jgi:hypothetical protein
MKGLKALGKEQDHAEAVQRAKKTHRRAIS